MPVSDTSKATTAGAWLSTGWSGLQPPTAGETVSRTPPCSVNLKAFDSRFFSTCCRRLESVDDAAAEMRIDLDVERRAARFSASWRNGRADRVDAGCRAKISSASTVTVPDSIFDRSRMSLIRFSRSVPAPWMVRANSTCFGDQVAVGVVGELLAEDQDAVQRRAQLVRHVGEEFGLVLRGERELGRLLLERAARLLDLLVLALDLDVALGELLRLLLELLVGLLQLASAASAARRRAAATA